MIRITVPSLPLKPMKGIGKVSQRPYDFQLQTAYAHTADNNGKPLPFPEKMELSVDTPGDAYAPGEYTLSPASLYVDNKGRLAVAPKLVPLKSQA